MGFYRRFVLPRLIDRAMGSERLSPLRAALAAEARGKVLELGIGSGPNLAHYGRCLHAVHGADPSPELIARARPKAAWMHFPVTFTVASAEDIPLESASFDTVVMSWTLCSVSDPLRALCEARRMLRADGQLLFVEHGRSHRPELARWQTRLTPFWRHVSGGCRLDRDVAGLLHAAGFLIERMETGHLVPGPRLFTYHYRGRARPIRRASDRSDANRRDAP